MSDTAIQIVSRDPAVQARYEQMIRDGESHSMAEMLATRSFPGLKTDSVWNAGRCNGNQFENEPGLGDWYAARAREAGVNPVGQTYISSLARFPGDPEAWVSGRGDVQKLCLQRGWGCDGVKVSERSPTPDIEVAPDLIESEVQDILSENPGSRYEDVYDRVFELRSGRVDPNAVDISGLSMDDFPAEALTS